MGFLDNVKKGLDDVAKGVNQAVSNVSNSSSSATGAPSSPPPPGTADPSQSAYDEFVDGTGPETWLAGWEEGPEGLIGRNLPVALAFAEPQVFETDEAYVARYVDATNGFTLDVGSVKEDLFDTFPTQEEMLAHFAGPLPMVDQVDLADYSIMGSSGPGHMEIVSCLADLVGKFDLYGPAWLDLGVAGDNLREVVLVAYQLYS